MISIWMFPKIVVPHLFHEKPYYLMDDLGGKNHPYFWRQTPICRTVDGQNHDNHDVNLPIVLATGCTNRPAFHAGLNLAFASSICTSKCGRNFTIFE